VTDAGSEVVRHARLTDRPALIELSRRVHAEPDAFRRSLGVPAPTATQPALSLSSLIPAWLPLRPTSVHLVAESGGRLVGSCRSIEEPHRDDWMIIELDAEDGPMAAEVRHAMLAQLIGEAMQRGIDRLHAACSDVRENLLLFGQLGFVAYAQEEICYRPPWAVGEPRSWLRGLTGRGHAMGAHPADDDGPALQPAGAPDAWHLFDLWTHCTPPAIARIERYAAADWESASHEGVVPRSALNPILHFSSVAAWLLSSDGRAAGFAQHGSSREGPHYLRFLVRDGSDGAAFLEAVLHAAGADAAAAGMLAPVRTYEAMGLRAAEAVGFSAIGRVSLLVRDVPAGVRRPAMVPAV